MNKEENFINTLFEKTEESEVVKPKTTEIIKMPMSSIVPNFKNPYKCREEDMKPLEDSIRENGIIQPLMMRYIMASCTIAGRCGILIEQNIHC